MTAIEILRKKRDGHALSPSEINFIIDAYANGHVPDYQMSALLMAVYLNGMSAEEMGALTQAMIGSGDVLDLAGIPGRKIDKHSTGGVGDKTSLILAPVAAAAGVKVPMISGRGLGHTGGTLDKLESIPGFQVNLPVDRFRRGVEKIGLCLIGQTDQLVPADRNLYALRDVTATVESIPLIVASIMSKKLAEGIDGLVLDVKVGRGAFMTTDRQAAELADALVATGRSMGKDVVALITAMDQPLGHNVGNALEVVESIATLRGEGPEDLTTLSVELAAEMIHMAALAPDLSAARRLARRQIENGRALAIFRNCIAFQGGDARVVDEPERLPRARGTMSLVADQSGYLTVIDAAAVGMASLLLGGGRLRKEDPIDPAVGIVLQAKEGDPVAAGQVLAEIHYNDEAKKDEARRRLDGAFRISDQPVPSPPLLRNRING
ncbi:MAG: thymidine phosphorylase [Acidobacteria bacterium]|nr:thymidine phosphorylase [Acidobacteriota bacterium]